MSLLNQRRYIRQVPGIVAQAKFTLGQGRSRRQRARRVLGRAMCALVVLAWIHATVALADAPTATPVGALTPTPGEGEGLPTLAAATPAPPAQGSTVQQATPTPKAPFTPTPEAPVSPTPTPVPRTVTATPADVAPPASQAGTAHLAIRVSDCVVSVGGTASSEVLVFLQDIRPGINGLHLSLRFDPQVVQLLDADGNTDNGIQIAPATFLNASQQVTENRVDNVAGQVSLTVTQEGSAPVQGNASWLKVATLTWIGQREGNSVVVVGDASHFTTPDGQRFAPNAAHNGTVFARAAGQIRGTVRLQGREEAGSAMVTSSLAVARTDQVRTAPDGHFALTPSYGEGFYTLVASAPGYLSAEIERPVKLTVGSAIDLGEVTLYGGDATGDNRIDVRDLSMVAWHLGTNDARADINGDGQVDILDLTLVAGNFGRVGPTAWEAPATP